MYGTLKYIKRILRRLEKVPIRERRCHGRELNVINHKLRIFGSNVNNDISLEVLVNECFVKIQFRAYCYNSECMVENK